MQYCHFTAGWSNRKNPHIWSQIVILKDGFKIARVAGFLSLLLSFKDNPQVSDIMSLSLEG